MFELEPGPLERLTLDQLRPFPARPSFEGLVVEHLSGLNGADTMLARSALRVTESPPDDLDALYATTVGAAADVVQNEIGNAPGSPAADLIDTGDNAGAIRRGVLRYLPNVDAPIAATSDDPPALPAAPGQPWYFGDQPPEFP